MNTSPLTNIFNNILVSPLSDLRPSFPFHSPVLLNFISVLKCLSYPPVTFCEIFIQLYDSALPCERILFVFFLIKKKQTNYFAKTIYFYFVMHFIQTVTRQGRAFLCLPT
jgi:hypothetical protein